MADSLQSGSTIMAGTGISPEKSDTKSITGQITKMPSFGIIHKGYDVLPFYEDSSIFRFVSRDVPLNEKSYEPDDLVPINNEHINMAGRSGLKMRKEARDSLWIMAADFEKKFGVPLTVISTYRSAAYQQWMWDLGKCTDSLCAPSGYSEHQLGLAMDVFDATTERDYEANQNYRRYIAWFKENAQRYGWTQSYQKGEAIDTYEVEPWHWRYVGVDMATKLRNLGWTYTEYVRFQQIIARR
ncbi:MAG: M15 family metallopeptidase [Candidatus Gracilibacteria bacterium]|nr:M15 family metallopeptidase [Candidatus Gracilibacteria bacterium]